MTSRALKNQINDHSPESKAASPQFSRKTYWLALPEVQQRYNEKATGRTGVTWYEHCLEKYLQGRLPVERMLSIGCETGQLERALAELGAFQYCDGIDTAEGPVAEARREAAIAGLANLSYRVASLERILLLDRYYDAVWFNMSLQHVQRLEHVCSTVAESLKPNGMVFINEYVGPNRFNFPARQKAVMRAAFALIPERYRRFMGDDRGAAQVVEELAIPEVDDVARIDPSEAVRSSEIRAIVNREFDVIDSYDAGGTLLQFLLNNIAGNFTQADEQSMKVLELLFSIEDVLMDTKDIGSDFAVIVARRKKG